MYLKIKLVLLTWYIEQESFKPLLLTKLKAATDFLWKILLFNNFEKNTENKTHKKINLIIFKFVKF